MVKQFSYEVKYLKFHLKSTNENSIFGWGGSVLYGPVLKKIITHNYLEFSNALKYILPENIGILDGQLLIF